ncbi:phospholipase B1, membrane-associated-like [Adelges cooleyi]|uniref:phospholipase B1, membrane-associated-like n=1 Tax=Adelges cooleyi TaxID=133065 RepID=UPI002180018A|nr:phospholipase B1, membrane-associated-like [Adelges cooleyi]XP_050427224.1 phospholipase B1, membrane-associated-like [Adelges cooleyi]XP_050427225.1 phospholipase B1, membrane-associated-like [Adelges cooleyi]XP_050427226.1 phospholipase B1, membrane-associated-like [Adelges cooleyi]XP_050427227.1 phospholipase B1, membrane-associated-like [Adelges cooleyi]XP_050427228.1 phospholipase B1, membrane-associated-like [Adelges cooleyi]XP_050427229.1 phospholipase B1, membrane-associated-like [
MYMVLLCLSLITALLGQSIISQAWLNRYADEDLSGIPQIALAFQDKHYYPLRRTVQALLRSPSRIEWARTNNKTQKAVPEAIEFPCKTNGTRSMTTPTSVHQIRPGDIDIIGSIGDSLTAGYGTLSRNLPEVLIEERGLSWSGGGEGTWREYLTLPNIIKVFNPDLFGYSYGASLAEQRASQFNVAEGAAVSQDIFYMTRELVKRIKNDKRVKLNEHWKLITIWIGANTFCTQICYEDHNKLTQLYYEKLHRALSYIKNNLPRTIVNFVLDFNVQILMSMSGRPEVCKINNILVCPCVFCTQFKQQIPQMMKTLLDFHKFEKNIVEMEEFKTQDDFTVIIQPFAEHLSFPLNRLNKTDLTFFAADCFHFSQKGYATFANALWNNMMEPVGHKSTNWTNLFDRFLCPTADSPFIKTWKNSATKDDV